MSHGKDALQNRAISQSVSLFEMHVQDVCWNQSPVLTFHTLTVMTHPNTKALKLLLEFLPDAL